MVDPIDAEIARLEAEIQGLAASTTTTTEPPAPAKTLRKLAPQRDYVVANESFALRDMTAPQQQTPNMIQSSSLLSYDEITVDTQEFAAASVQQPSLLGPLDGGNARQNHTPAHLLYPSHPADTRNEDGVAPPASSTTATTGPLDSFLTASGRSKPDDGATKPVEQARTKQVKKKVSVRKVRKKRPTSTPSSSSLNSEAARLQAEIDKMEAELAAAAAVAPANEESVASPNTAEATSTRPPPPAVQPPPAPRQPVTATRGTAVETKPSSRATPKPSPSERELEEMQRIEAEIAMLEGQIAGGGGSSSSSTSTPTQPSPAATSRPSHPAPKPSGNSLVSAPKEEASAEEDQPPAPPVNPMMGLLGALQQAANDRTQRLDETDGKLLMQDVAPEVEEISKGPMQLSTSMAEMISQRAAARDKRLADGGEKRMRKVEIKEKDEYKKEFSDIMSEAASMGRLTRLNEHVVEAVAQEKTREQEWKSNGLLAIQWRSNHMAVIHEAANVGNQCKMPEEIVSNCPEEEQHMDWEDAQHISERKRQLLEVNSTVGEGQQKVDKLLNYLKDEQETEHLLIKPMDAYANVEEVKLPRRAPPKVDPTRNAERLSKMKQEAIRSGRPMIDISVSVAEKAWERRARLDRPGAMPKIVEKCDCPYCENASPFQTAAYRKREIARRHGLHEEEEEAPAPQPTHDEIERKRQERRQKREESRRLQMQKEPSQAARPVEPAVQPAPPAVTEAQLSAVETKAPAPIEVTAPPEAACCSCAIM